MDMMKGSKSSMDDKDFHSLPKYARIYFREGSTPEFSKVRTTRKKCMNEIIRKKFVELTERKFSLPLVSSFKQRPIKQSLLNLPDTLSSVAVSIYSGDLFRLPLMTNNVLSLTFVLFAV
jgi:hypothetical protein